MGFMWLPPRLSSASRPASPPRCDPSSLRVLLRSFAQLSPPPPCEPSRARVFLSSSAPSPSQAPCDPSLPRVVVSASAPGCDPSRPLVVVIASAPRPSHATCDPSSPRVVIRAPPEMDILMPRSPSTRASRTRSQTSTQLSAASPGTSSSVSAASATPSRSGTSASVSAASPTPSPTAAPCLATRVSAASPTPSRSGTSTSVSAASPTPSPTAAPRLAARVSSTSSTPSRTAAPRLAARVSAAAPWQAARVSAASPSTKKATASQHALPNSFMAGWKMGAFNCKPKTPFASKMILFILLLCVSTNASNAATASGHSPTYEGCNAKKMANLVVTLCETETETEAISHKCCSIVYQMIGQKSCYCNVRKRSFFEISPLSRDTVMDQILHKCRAGDTMHAILHSCNPVTPPAAASHVNGTHITMLAPALAPVRADVVTSVPNIAPSPTPLSLTAFPRASRCRSSRAIFIWALVGWILSIVLLGCLLGMIFHHLRFMDLIHRRLQRDLECQSLLRSHVQEAYIDRPKIRRRVHCRGGVKDKKSSQEAQTSQVTEAEEIQKKPPRVLQIESAAQATQTRIGAAAAAGMRKTVCNVRNSGEEYVREQQKKKKRALD